MMIWPTFRPPVAPGGCGCRPNSCDGCNPCGGAPNPCFGGCNPCLGAPNPCLCRPNPCGGGSSCGCG
ncbi:MAG: hypothetical protein RR452_01100, partial [Clostridia bacterium]